MPKPPFRAFPFEKLDWDAVAEDLALADHLRVRARSRSEWPRIAERDLRRFFTLLRWDRHVWEEYCAENHPRRCACSALATVLPDHVCDDTARWSTFEYAVMHPQVEAPVDYPNLYPLPIDRASILAWECCVRFGRHHPPPSALGRWAALVVGRENDCGRVWLFGLAEPDGIELGEALRSGEPIPWRFIAPAIRIEYDGYPVERSDPLAQMSAELSRWYATNIHGLRLKAVGPGRPRGSGFYPTRESFLAAFGPAVQVLRRRHRRAPRPSEVLRLLNGKLGEIPAPRFTEWRQRLGWKTWDDFLHDVKDELEQNFP